MSTTDLQDGSPGTRPLSRSYRRFLWFRRIILFLYAPLMAALALWPCPYKYPWILPLAVAFAAFVILVLWKSGGDVGAALVLAATVAGLATWTLAHLLGLGVLTGLMAFVASILPAVVFVLLLATLAGSADDPRYEDES